MERIAYKIIEDVITAADYGAPQTRQRAVIIGVRGTLKDDLKFPAPLFEAGKYRTVRDERPFTKKGFAS